MGVPVNAVPPFPSSSPHRREPDQDVNARCTVLVAAVLHGPEDLVLELLALPGQGDLDLERELGPGDSLFLSPQSVGWCVWCENSWPGIAMIWTPVSKMGTRRSAWLSFASMQPP